MLLYLLLLTPLLGIFYISIKSSYTTPITISSSFIAKQKDNNNLDKIIVLIISIINFCISLIIYILFDFSTNQFQFVQEYINMNVYEIYLGIDGISIYFIILTTFIIPLSLISN
jgi:NADH-ubiquinone oxidoreductase chain 4